LSKANKRSPRKQILQRQTKQENHTTSTKKSNAILSKGLNVPCGTIKQKASLSELKTDTATKQNKSISSSRSISSSKKEQK